MSRRVKITETYSVNLDRVSQIELSKDFANLYIDGKVKTYRPNQDGYDVVVALHNEAEVIKTNNTNSGDGSIEAV